MTSDCRLFECTQCGDCCKGFGGTYVSETDLEAIARFIETTADVVARSYCNPSGPKLVLGQRSDGYCIFWDRNCTIHPVKPEMCRRWPFITSLLKDVQNWHMMASVCPGMRTDLDDHALAICIHKKMQ